MYLFITPCSRLKTPTGVGRPGRCCPGLAGHCPRKMVAFPWAAPGHDPGSGEGESPLMPAWGAGRAWEPWGKASRSSKTVIMVEMGCM